MQQNTKAKRLSDYVPDYVVFDLETTGINPSADAIIEISALKVENKKVVDSFTTLVNPERSIPYRATAINGITDEMVAEAPVIRQVLPEFLTFTESRVLVGHNIHTFDLKFINNAAGQLFGEKIENNYVDTLYMSRSCLPQLKHHKLIDLSAYFNISSEGAHRAMNDCIMNQKCFEALAGIQADIITEVCPSCGGELSRRSGRFGEFWGCSNYPKCRFTKNV